MNNFENKKQAIVLQAERLKENLWALLSEIGDPPFGLRDTMNQLLDEIEGLEHD